MQILYFAIVIIFLFNFSSLKIYQHYQNTFRNGDFIFGKLVSLQSSGPKMGFREVNYGSNNLVGLKALNMWFIGDL
jgi:hypothetical protein